MITFLSLPHLAGVLIPLLVKATLVILLALGITELLRWRHGPAAARHLVWALAIGALLALPVLTWSLPQWRIEVLSLPAPAPAAAHAPSVEPLSYGEIPAMIPNPPPPPAAPLPRSGYPATSETALPLPRSWMPRVGAGMPRIELAQLALALYLAGVLFLLLRVWVGRWSVRSLARAAEPMDDPAWAELLRALMRKLGVERPVRLLRSREATLPMTWGTRRPAILLPAEAEAWPEERRRVVLLHELAHVLRRDCLVQTLAALACALYWFHPLVWYAARRLRFERELACDDQVLAAGTRAKSYAAHLLEVARAYHPPSLTSAVAISMARPSQLEDRLLAVLDRTRSRRALSGRTTRVALALALVLLLPLATLQPQVARAATPLRDGIETLPAVYAFPLEEAAADTIPGQVIERTLPARSGGQLTLHLATGGEVRVTSWERQAVFVRAELDGPDWRGTHVAITPTAEGVRVESSQQESGRSYGTSHEFEIRVPRRFDVEVRSNGGGIRISDLEGTFSGRTNGGELHLERLRGTVRLSTNGGEILVTDSHLEGEVRTNGGDVELRNVTGSLHGFTNGGSMIRSSASASGVSQAIRQHHARDEAGFAYATGEGEARRRAMRELAQNAPAAAAALERLAFQERSAEAQREAARSLGELPGDAGLQGLIRIARAHPGEEPRREATVGLGRLACDEAITVLRTVIESDPAPGVQREAVRALAATYARTDVQREIRPLEIRRMLEPIARSHPDRRVRAQAVAELQALELPDQGLAPDPTGERLPLRVDERALAARVSDAALRGAADAAAIRRLRQLLGHAKAHAADLVRERATWALAQVREGRLIEPLVAALRDHDWRVRSYAAWALGMADDQRATKPLIATLADPVWRVRAHAAASLGNLSNRNAVGPLLALLRDPEWQVRAAAVEALGDLGDTRALAALEPLLHDPHLAVRDVAEPALKKLRKLRG